MDILLIDDHALFRQSMALVLNSLDSTAHIYEAGTAARGIDIAKKTLFDLVLLDLNLPEMGGFTALGHLLQQQPNLKVMMLSASEDCSDARMALDNGALGYIPKSATSQIMVGAIRLVLSGGIYVPPLILAQLGLAAHARPMAAHGNEPVPILTSRQKEVLAYLGAGKSNKEIARHLDMAEGTVKIHVTAIFKVLGAVNRTQAVLAAERWGLVNTA